VAEPLKDDDPYGLDDFNFTSTKQDTDSNDPYGLDDFNFTSTKKDDLEATQDVIDTDEEDVAEIDDLGLEFNYDKWKNSDKLKDASIRFAKNHLGYDEINADDAVDETIEHFRKFSVNELTAARDYNYVSALVADKKQDQLTDYKQLYTAFEKLPTAFSRDAAPGAFLDYAEGIIKAPSTYLGLLLPAAGKVGGLAAQKTAQLGVSRIINAALLNPAKRPLVSTAIIEGVGGSLQNVAEQKTLLEADLQDEYSFLSTGLAAGVSAATGAGVGLMALKGKAVKYIEKDTGEIVEESIDAITKRKKAATDKAIEITTSKKGKKVAQSLKEKLDALDPEKVMFGRQTAREMAEAEGISDPLRLAFNPDKYDQVLGFLTDALARTTHKDAKTGALKVGLKEGERITDGITRVIREMRIDEAPDVNNAFGKLLRDYDLNMDDLGNLIAADVSESARILQKAGQAKKLLSSEVSRLSQSLDDVMSFDLFGYDKQIKDQMADAKKLLEKHDVRGFVETIDPDGAKGILGKTIAVGRELDALRLGLMTSQTATTVRNYVSGITNVGFDTLTRGLDLGLKKIAGKSTLSPNSEVFGVAYGLINKKEAAAVETIFEMGFEEKASKLFRQLADIGSVGGGMPDSKVTALGHIARNANALNTISDNMFKRAALVGNLKRSLNQLYRNAAKDPRAYREQFGKELAADDFNLISIMKNGRFNDVFGTKQGQKALDKVVNDSLFFTFQRPPQNALSRALVNNMHRVPFLGSSFVPFPRFIMNAMRFTYEYSPAYLILNKEAREQTIDVGKSALNRIPLVNLKTNDEVIESYTEASKGLVGLGVLTGATAFRMNQLETFGLEGGERWYEGRNSKGETFDMRPFFPAAPYLFFGDFIARQMMGEPLKPQFVQGAIQALSGTQFRAGLGLYALEDAVGNIIEQGFTGEAAAEIATRATANIVATYSIPFTAGQDLYNTFVAPDDERVVKDRNVENLWNLLVYKGLSRIPGNNAIEKKLAEFGVIREAPDVLITGTSKEKIRRKIPISRQTSGILYNERKNRFEKELDRLGISRASVYGGKSGIREYDYLYKLLIREYVDEHIIPFTKTKKYKDAPELKLGDKKISKAEHQATLLKDRIAKFKTEVSSSLREYQAGESAKKIYGFNPIERFRFERVPEMYRKLAQIKYSEQKGTPKKYWQWDYGLLNKIARSEMQKANVESTFMDYENYSD